MPQFQPDMRTLFQAGALMYLLDAVMLVILWISHRKHLSGTGYWVIAFFFFVAGALLIGARGAIPGFASYVLANSFYVAAFLVMLDGFRAIEGASKRYRWNYLWIALFIPFFYWFTLVDLNYRLRVSVEFLLFAGITFQIVLLHKGRIWNISRQRVAYILIALIFGSMGFLFLMASVLILFVAGREDHVLLSGPPQYLIGFVQLYTTIGMVIGIILQMNSKLLERSEAAENSLREANANLLKEKSDKEGLLLHYSKMAMIGEMMSAISHQWKQPVTAISLIAGELEEQVQFKELTPHSALQLAKDIYQQIDFMTRTMEGFRDFFHPGSEDLEFDPGRMVEEIAGLFSRMLKSQNVELLIETHEAFLVRGKPNEFKQVILNLITNAREAITERKVASGKIILSFEEVDRQVLIHITDNGGGLPSGIPPETLFEPYKTSGKAKGEGLGLSLIRMIVVERMKGSVRASNLGEGARFTISLPLAGKGRE